MLLLPTTRHITDMNKVRVESGKDALDTESGKDALGTTVKFGLSIWNCRSPFLQALTGFTDTLQFARTSGSMFPVLYVYRFCS